MKDDEYKNLIRGTIGYGIIGIVFGYFGYITTMIIFGIAAVLRASPALFGPVDEKDQDKG